MDNEGRTLVVLRLLLERRSNRRQNQENKRRNKSRCEMAITNAHYTPNEWPVSSRGWPFIYRCLCSRIDTF